MASSRDDSHPQPRHDQELNPFVAFRRFADEQMASLWYNILGPPISFPSSTRSRSKFSDAHWQRGAAEERQRNDQEAKKQMRISDTLPKAHHENSGFGPPTTDENNHDYCQTGIGWMSNSPEGEEIRGLVRLARRLARLASQEVAQGQRDVERINGPESGYEQEAMRCPYRPGDQEVPLQNQTPQPSSNNPLYDTTPSTVSSHLNRLIGGPIFGYVLWSPYSPLRLEHDFSLQDRPVAWRRAFEDLTGVQIKGDLPDREKSEKGSFGEWRDRVGKSLQIYESNPGNRETMDATNPDNETGPDEITELDLYERFLGTQYPQATPSPPASTPTSNSNPTTSQTPAASIPADDPNPAIISTLTTTERNTFPDGSVHTKVMLKKRFADGREESTETLHTSHGLQAEGPGSAQPFLVGEAKDASKKYGGEGIAQQAKKKGWFWS